MVQIPIAAAMLVVAAATLLAVAVRRYLLVWTSVTSESMLPTLRPGDRRLTLRTGRLRRIERGDIVVARSHELGTDVIKRVIGLPGDAVTVDDSGAVEVGGSPLVEPYVARPGGPGGRFVVPPGAVLVLGDNRQASSDSRVWHDPYLPQAALRGRLVRRQPTRTS